MSTTALSHAIGKLEASLGVRCPTATRSVPLTDGGRLFVEQEGPALQDIQGALDAVRSHRETPSGTIRINAAPFAGREKGVLCLGTLVTGSPGNRSAK